MIRRTFLACLFAAIPAAAQESGSSPDVPPESETPVAIPISGVTSRAEELAANLRRIDILLEPSDEVERVGSAIERETASIVELRSELDGIDMSRISLRMLEDHRHRWSEVDENLDGWSSVLERRWSAVSEEAEELSRLRGTWEATRAQAVSDDAPPEVIELILTQLEAVAGTEKRLHQRMASIAAVLDRAVQRKQSSAEALQRLSGIASEMRGRLFVRDAPPIWRLVGYIERRSLLEDADEARKYWLDTLIMFVSARRAQFLLLLASFLVLCLTAFATQRWSRSWPPDDAEVERARFVVSRPVSMAVAFTLVLMVVFMSTPIGPLDDLVIFLALVPIVRLGAGLVPLPARVGFYGLAVLLVIDRLWTLAPDGSFLQRSALLVVTAVALAGSIALMVRWRRTEETRTGAWWRFAWVLVLLAAALFSVSLIANTLGWSNLSQSVTGSTIEAAFVAHAWITVVLAGLALVPVAIRSPLGDLLPTLRRHASMVSRIAFFVAAALALWRWTRTTLQRFQLYEPVRNRLANVLDASVTIGGLEVSMGRVSTAILILVSTWLTARIVRFALREEILPRFRLPAIPSCPSPTTSFGAPEYFLPRRRPA